MSYCRFPGCTQDKYRNSFGHANGGYCPAHTSAYNRRRHQLQAATVGRVSYGYNQFESDVQAGFVSVQELLDSLGKYRYSHRRHADQEAQPIETVLATLHDKRPLKSMTDYPQDGKQDFNRRPCVVKCKFWRKRVEFWLALNGVFRPARPFDDVSRARAAERLAELMNKPSGKAGLERAR